VPAFNPYNPFGETVLVSEEIPVRNRSAVNQNFFLPLVGVRGSLLDKWHWEIAGWSSQEWDASTFIGPNFGGLFGALFSGDPATALNPFVTGPQSPSVESAIYSNNASHLSGGNLTANGFIRGPILTLASGEVQAVIGAEYNHSKLTNKALNSPTTLDQRDEHSFFGELSIPIIANHLHPEAGDTLAVGAAIRYDDYSDFGGHTTPQFSITWRPSETVLIRGAFSESFRAPNLYDLFAFATPVIHPNYPVIDPLNGNMQVLTTVILESRPLKPETGQSRSIGFVWSPESIQNFQMSMTYWGMGQSNRVSEPNVQDIVDNANLFPGCVIRGPGTPGPIQSVCGGFFNFGTLSVSGFDGDIAYKYQTDFGTLTPAISATEIYKYKAALVPGAPITDRVSKANLDAWAPRWKGTASLGWSLGPYSAAIDGRYVGKYRDYAPLVNGPSAGTYQTLGNYWVFDANIKVGIGDLVEPNNPYLKDTYISVGGVNLFNILPPFSMYSNGLSGYDPSQYDIRGRFLYVNLGLRY
jgi:iron complex outermembrane receptor protein